MRTVLQKVDRAVTTVDSQIISSIGKGLLVFLGVERGDGSEDAEYLLEKIINLRIFEDRDGKLNLCLGDIAGEMLVVSQFTLLGDCRKGRRPSFDAAAPPELAEKLYEDLTAALAGHGLKVATGRFRQMMEVGLINDGPVTLLLDSKKAF